MIDILWDDSKGPFENIFSGVQKLSMLFGPMHIQAITFAASLFGLGLPNLGKKIDEVLDLRSIGDISDWTPEDAAEELINASDSNDIFAEASLLNFKSSNYDMIKEAGKLSLIVSFFRKAFSILKGLAIGAGGLYIMNKVEDAREESSTSTPQKSKSPWKTIDLSIKKTPNTYRQNLEGRIDKILSQ